MSQVGRVKWWAKEKGFGFLIGDDGVDYFVHYTDIIRTSVDKVNLDEGQRVEFEVANTPKGLRATKVTPA